MRIICDAYYSMSFFMCKKGGKYASIIRNWVSYYDTHCFLAL